MYKYLSLILSLFIFLGIYYTNNSYSGTYAKFIVIITVDGLRPDAITETDTPNIYSLLKKSSYTLKANTIEPSLTLPAHTSLVTGLSPENFRKLQITWDNSSNYIEDDTIFSLSGIKGLDSAMFVGKGKLGYIANPKYINHFYYSNTFHTSIRTITNSFLSYFLKNKPELTLIHFPEPDISGHKYGWMSKKYLIALNKVDKSISQIIKTMEDHNLLKDILFIITADHGGVDKAHELDDPLVKTIPWIAYGSGIKKNHKIEKEVFIYDTAPTVLKAFDIRTNSKMDGKPITEIFIDSQIGSSPN